ncbi:LIM domain [Popillia japonica]|uniref:LIM domain n=1 Tax=Popillia japonica TaxID=7064 RepID=A0AAW1KS99_POPJA
MDPQHKDADADKKNYNTEYLPTKCRVTKPPPPKPATNPLQFVKVAPCPLFQKAQEQIKKVEEIKVMRKEVRDEAEDWQQNLDNWKSSRRKRQEHIIERVVEVKKLEQEETQRGRKKNKTFSEMMEERSRGRHKFNIPIYNDDDTNDLSDYGIGSSSSKTNSIKDVDTDDNSSVLDEKDDFNKDNLSASNQSQSEDELNTKPPASNDSRSLDFPKDCNNGNTQTKPNIYTTNMYTNLIKSSYTTTSIKTPTRTTYDSILNSTSTEINLLEKPQYTYEGAIQDYRTRIRSKINIDESIFNKPYECKNKDSDVQNIVPKGNIFKRKEIFEVENRNDTNLEATRRLSEDFANSQSIKERLQSLEKCTDQALKNSDKKMNQIGSVKTRLQNFNKQNEADTKNNNNNKPLSSDLPINNKISYYLLDKSNSTSKFEAKKNSIEVFDRSSSPETEMYMNKLNMFNRDLDNLMYGKSIHSIDNDLDDFVRSSNYPPSTSSTEVMALSSDRDDSGIHTADVSCSVSQADEPFEDTDLSSTIPICIEKLTIVKENESLEQEDEPEDTNKEVESKDSLDINVNSIDNQSNENETITTDLSNNNLDLYDINYLKEITEDILEFERKDCTYNIANPTSISIEANSQPPTLTEPPTSPEKPDRKPVIYENVKISPYENVEIKTSDITFPMDFIASDIFGNPISPGKLEPPKVKPPPPPPQEIYDGDGNFKRMNSTKRIKKEIQIKRSSFLGLSEPTDDQIDPEIPIDKPPDINSFLQKESRMEKSMYKKLQGSREGGFSEVESQDSGLEIERGRLSSDTWCSSLIDSSTPIHERQDSEQTNSFTSEEDEITKKEREIIELVEKEEKSRDSDYSSQTTLSPVNNKHDDMNSYNNIGNKFDRAYYTPRSGYGNNLDTSDTEMMRVEQELLQLEREEMERKRDNLLFGNCAKIRQNRHSLENICDVSGYSGYNDSVGYRKSMPELQHIPIEYRKSLPDVPNYKPAPEIDFQYRKSMPDIQHAYTRSMTDYCNNIGQPDVRSRLIDHRKSMPELQQEMQRTGFRSPPPIVRQQPIIPAKPLRVLTTEQQDKDRLNSEPELMQTTNKHVRPLTRHSLHVLSAVPRPRHLPNDNWIQQKPNAEPKNYNQHWLYQEAEFRRISEQENAAAIQNRNWQPRSDKHIPDSVIQSLTQRVQNRGVITDRNPPALRNIRPENSSNKDYTQHPYLGHHPPQTLGHALPLSHPPSVQIEDTQDKMLSVSGKKKCSNCGNELGRGAAMIIESLCLFYHMECFKCCVCHMRLGDGLMGTDVRVRNQKLHCHNCYSSEDGVKFSCV